MSIFVSSTPPPRAKTTNIHSIRLFFAGILTLIVLLQLFTFEEFAQRLNLAGISTELASILAVSLVVTEVFSLPFILRMQLSYAFRVVSMIAGWAAVLTLLGIAIVENIQAPAGLDAMFGATIPLPVGMWTICLALALCVLAGWTSWGMWPFPAKK